MKKYICFLAAILLLSFACTEKDLDLQPTQENAVAYYQQADNIETILWMSYNALLVRTGPWGNSQLTYGNFPSDDAYAGGADDHDQQTLQDADNYDVTPLDPGANLTTMWRTNFQGIYYSNLIIEFVPETKDFNRQAIAEAKFMKALYYFQLSRIFGGLPLMELTLSSKEQKPRSTIEETRKFIEDLLVSAVNAKRLDGTTPALQTRTTTTDPANGRATLASAQALLGKILLYEGKYDEAAKILLEIDNNANYALETNFESIFSTGNKHGKESIFEVNYTTVNGAASEPFGNGEIQLFGPRQNTITQFNDDILGGWGFDQPTADLVNAFKSQNDVVRLKATALTNDSLEAIYYANYLAKGGVAADYVSIKDTWTNNPDGYWDNKHLCRLSNRGSAWGNFKNNNILLRLSDVYLMLAEAYNRSGKDADAQKYLNKVRARVGLSNVTKTGTDLFEAIKLERRLELALEGERYFDLQRWGDADKTLGADYADGKPGTKTKGLFPIPQTEIDKTSGPDRLIQNDGY